MEKICPHCKNLFTYYDSMKFCPFCGNSFGAPPRPAPMTQGTIPQQFTQPQQYAPPSQYVQPQQQPAQTQQRYTQPQPAQPQQQQYAPQQPQYAQPTQPQPQYAPPQHQQFAQPLYAQPQQQPMQPQQQQYAPQQPVQAQAQYAQPTPQPAQPQYTQPQPVQQPIQPQQPTHPQPAKAQPVQKQQSTETSAAVSKFTGGAFGLFGVNLGMWIGSLLTLFLAFPWLYCWKLRWFASHTYINGKQQVFDGTGGQLIGTYIKWIFFLIITFGIYSFWMILNMQRWQTKHTHFAGGNSEQESVFDGRLIQLIGVTLGSFFLLLITFFIGYFWIACWKERWYAKHTVIDGQRLAFDGKGLQYFGLLLKQILLTIITFGIYTFWLVVSAKKWVIKHTRLRLASEPLEEDKPGHDAAVAMTIFEYVFLVVPIVNFIFACVAVKKSKQCESKAMLRAARVAQILSIAVIAIEVWIFTHPTTSSVATP